MCVRLVLLLIAVLFLLCCSASTNTNSNASISNSDPTASQNRNNDVCEIYAVILTEKYAAKMFVVKDAVGDFPCGKGRSDPYPFDGSGNVVFLTDVEEKKIFEKYPNYWSGFHQKYPESSGIIGLGNISFNDDHTQAKIEVSRQGGPKNGEGRNIELRKKDGKWFIFSDRMTWAS